MARSIDPDRSADCHASGQVPTAAFLIKGGQDLTMCAHHIGKAALKLAADGWEIIPIKRVIGTGVGTEATPDHHSLGERA